MDIKSNYQFQFNLNKIDSYALRSTANNNIDSQIITSCWNLIMNTGLPKCSFGSYFWSLNLWRKLILKIIPRINTIIPAIINIEPLIVQEGLLYINELEGPNSDLDCAVKIKPANMSMAPIISTNIFIYYQLSRDLPIYMLLRCRYLNLHFSNFTSRIKIPSFLVYQQLDWIDC